MGEYQAFQMVLMVKQLKVLHFLNLILSVILVNWIKMVNRNDQGQNRTYQYIAPSLQNGITFLESKEAAMQRKQVQAGKASHISDDPIPMDVDSPF